MARGLTFVGVSEFVRKYIQGIYYAALVAHYMDNGDHQKKAIVDKISPEAIDKDLAISVVD